MLEYYGPMSAQKRVSSARDAINSSPHVTLSDASVRRAECSYERMNHGSTLLAQCGAPVPFCTNGLREPRCALTPEEPLCDGPGRGGLFLWPLRYALAVRTGRVVRDGLRSTALIPSM